MASVGLYEPARYTRGHLWLARAIGVAAVGIAFLIKFVIRPELGPASGGLALLLGAGPSFFAAVGIPFFILFAERLTWPVRNPRFASECLWGFVILVHDELWELRSDTEVFDVVDIVALATGAAFAFYLFHRVVLRRRPPVFALSATDSHPPLDPPD